MFGGGRSAPRTMFYGIYRAAGRPRKHAFAAVAIRGIGGPSRLHCRTKLGITVLFGWNAALHRRIHPLRSKDQAFRARKYKRKGHLLMRIRTVQEGVRPIGSIPYSMLAVFLAASVLLPASGIARARNWEAGTIIEISQRLRSEWIQHHLEPRWHVSYDQKHWIQVRRLCNPN